jgi:hypothetical protein
MILFVQPFGLGTPGGGSRIFRALLENAPVKWLSVAARPNPTPPPPFGEEIHVRGRPCFGRLERTRFAHWFQNLDGWAGSRLETKLEQIVKQHKVTAIHGIAHYCWDTLAAFKVAKQNGLPFFLAVHDDPAYCLKGHPLRDKLLPALVACWREAHARFVICEEMGQELCRRWGKQDYILVTDGLADIAKQPRPQHPNRLSVYFMGLLHISYEPNFVALQKALRLISEQNPGLKVSLTLRGAMLRREAVVYPEMLRTLPFASELEVRSDLENADVLYQPLSLDPAGWSMNAYSLSTKMITYLGSGLPIFFHGPSDSAAGKLLARHQAAFVCDSNDQEKLAQTLMPAVSTKRELVVNSALNLAARQFWLRDIRARFWGAMKNN